MAVIDNTIVTTDVAPAISVDLVSNLVTSIRSLQEVLGVTDLTAMPEGAIVNMYNTTVGDLQPQTTEGDVIPLTEVTQQAVDPITISLNLYRKLVTAQAIQKVGRERAIYDTDRALIGKVRNSIKNGFYTSLASAVTETQSEGLTSLQEALARAWASLHTAYVDFDVEPVHFVNPLDVADYLGKATITTQTAFGFDYVENFLGLGTVIFAPNITANSVISTAKENLRGAYVPANGAVGQEFDLTADESGLVGITHSRNLERGAIESMLATGVKFFADGGEVFKTQFTPAGA